MKRKYTQEEVDEIRNYLESKDLYYEIYDWNGQIVIEIEHGDWKHDHARSDYLMSELGYKLVNEEETYTDGSDNYSAIHYYEKANDNKQKGK